MSFYFSKDKDVFIHILFRTTDSDCVLFRVHNWALYGCGQALQDLLKPTPVNTPWPMVGGRKKKNISSGVAFLLIIYTKHFSDVLSAEGS